jgi:prepilin-type N-terminal cleavage/methylation domain-containing protein
MVTQARFVPKVVDDFAVPRVACYPEAFMATRRNASERGFTLTELMVVIVLISILASLAFPSLRKRIEQARGRVGAVELGAIAAAQERFRAENMMYFDVSASLTSFYPVATPTPQFRSFRQPSHVDYARWEVLGPLITEPTPYVFATMAGLANATLPVIDPALIAVMPGGLMPANPTQNQWFVVQGQGNLDGDAKTQGMLMSSFDRTVYLLNEGE